jgi:hypothetical protein
MFVIISIILILVVFAENVLTFFFHSSTFFSKPPVFSFSSWTLRIELLLSCNLSLSLGNSEVFQVETGLLFRTTPFVLNSVDSFISLFRLPL